MFLESAKTVYTCFFHLSRIKIGIVQLLLRYKQKTIQEIALEWLEMILFYLIPIPSLPTTYYLLGWKG